MSNLPTVVEWLEIFLANFVLGKIITNHAVNAQILAKFIKRKIWPCSVFMYPAAIEPPRHNSESIPNIIPGKRTSQNNRTSPVAKSVIATITSNKLNWNYNSCNDY